MNQNNTLPEPEMEFQTRDNKKYKVELIINSAIYGKETKNQLLGLYYLLLLKSYPKEKSTWELLATVMYLRKLISIFYKEHLKKQIVTFLRLDSISPIVRPTIVKKPKQKCGHPSKKANKRDEK